jgi:penicillin-insensitive murein endopeptidase
MRRFGFLLNAAMALAMVLSVFAVAFGEEAKVAPASSQVSRPFSTEAATTTPSGDQTAPGSPAKAPDKPAVVKKPPPPPAKDLFGAIVEPAALPVQAIGFYANGCLAGGMALPIDGPAWQVMRLSRNRNWGHPSLVQFIERFAQDAKEKDGWPGLLVGDMSMPRGGPMPFGHASHQIGLDVDFWYLPMPGRTLTAEERESIPLESFVKDSAKVDPDKWSPDYEKLMRRVASYPEVTRIFVNPVIKKWLCDTAKGDRGFLYKIQPIHGHDDHFHVRLICPAGSATCQNQPPMPAVDGCGKHLDQEVAQLARAAAAPKPAPAPAPAQKPAKPVVNAKAGGLTMAQLPPACLAVLKAAPQRPAQVAATPSAGSGGPGESGVVH